MYFYTANLIQRDFPFTSSRSAMHFRCRSTSDGVGVASSYFIIGRTRKRRHRRRCFMCAEVICNVDHMSYAGWDISISGFGRHLGFSRSCLTSLMTLPIISPSSETLIGLLWRRSQHCHNGVCQSSHTVLQNSRFEKVIFLNSRSCHVITGCAINVQFLKKSHWVAPSKHWREKSYAWLSALGSFLPLPR